MLFNNTDTRLKMMRKPVIASDKCFDASVCMLPPGSLQIMENSSAHYGACD